MVNQVEANFYSYIIILTSFDLKTLRCNLAICLQCLCNQNGTLSGVSIFVLYYSLASLNYLLCSEINMYKQRFLLHQINASEIRRLHTLSLKLSNTSSGIGYMKIGFYLFMQLYEPYAKVQQYLCINKNRIQCGKVFINF